MQRLEITTTNYVLKNMEETKNLTSLTLKRTSIGKTKQLLCQLYKQHA